MKTSVLPSRLLREICLAVRKAELRVKRWEMDVGCWPRWSGASCQMKARNNLKGATVFTLA